MNRKLQVLFLIPVIVLNILVPAQEKNFFPGKKLKSITSGKFNLPEEINSHNFTENNLLSGAAGNEFWSSDFGLPGTDQYAFAAYVYGIAETSNDIYIAGRFKYAQDSLVKSFARLEGVKFSCVGGGTNGYIYAIKTVGESVYVGGEFDTAGSIPAKNIAMWDGSAWHSLGDGVDGAVNSIEAMGGNVFAGGLFDSADSSPAKHIAVWNGSSWSPAGEGANGEVRTLKAVGSNLYIGGDFDSAGTIAVNNIAVWNGVAYDSLSSGTDGIVNVIESEGGTIYIGGEFIYAGGIEVNHIAKWQSGSWSGVGSGVDNRVFDIEFYNGSMYIGGMFGYVGILQANGVAKWDGIQWSTLGSGMYFTMYGMPGVILTLKFIDGYLFAGGGFDRAGNISANNLAYWDGGEWRGVGPAAVIGGSDWVVNKVVMHNGELYAGGGFRRIGNIAASCIAKWNGSEWIELGGGVKSSGDPPTVNMIYCSGDDIYVGGYFDQAGSINVRNIAKWNGSVWSSLGEGLNDPVWDIKEAGGSIFVAGGFDTAGTVPAKHIARWNGSSWSALGNGLNGSVRAILPVGSDLYACGYFNLSGPDTMNYIAKWNGFTWSKLGKGLNQGCLSLCFDNGVLYAGGTFTEAGGDSASYIAAWNGSSWSPLGNGLSSSSGTGGAAALAAADGRLYAGGMFNQAGTLNTANVAMYEDGSWHRLGEGIGRELGVVYGSFVDYRDASDYDIYFSGIFSHAGGKASYNIAKYSVTAVEVENETNKLPKNFSLQQNYPNPFNPNTRIKYSVPITSLVTIRIYDILGEETAVLVNEQKTPGEYEVNINANDLSSGIYFYQLKAGSYIQTKKMLLLK